MKVNILLSAVLLSRASGSPLFERQTGAGSTGVSRTTTVPTFGSM
jgi:hypothetical protein